jgi:hypothetical protein
MALKVALLHYGTFNIPGNERQIANRLAAGLTKLANAIQNQNVEFLEPTDFDANATDTTFLNIDLVSMGPGHQPSAQFCVGALIKFRVHETDLGDGEVT